MTKTLTPAEVATEESAYLKGRFPEWNSFSPAMKLQALHTYRAARDKAAEPPPLEAFQMRMTAKWGPEYKTRMGALDKMEMGRILKAEPKAKSEPLSDRDRDWQRLAQLKAGGADDTPNSRVARIGLIADLERKLAGGKS